jgi:hypothetical protein
MTITATRGVQWTDADSQAARAEGWGIDYSLLEFVPTNGRLSGKAAAMVWVATRAVNGDPLARRAIRFLSERTGLFDAAVARPHNR